MKTMRKRWVEAVGPNLAIGLLFLCGPLGCGHSQEEWDQQARETDALRGQLRSHQMAAATCEAEFQSSMQEVEQLKSKLTERGIDLENAAASVEIQRRALHEYAARAEQLQRHAERLDALRRELEGAKGQGISVEVRDNHLSIRLPADQLFDAKSALSERGKAALTQIAAALSKDPAFAERDFQVQAHVDDASKGGAGTKDAFGASLERARAVLTFLVNGKATGGAGLSPAHWSAVGYGSSKPAADNATEAGRAANRRVDLVLMHSADETLNLNGLAR